MKICVGVPSHDTVPVLFAYDLAQLGVYTVASLPEEVPFGLTLVSGTYIHSARQQLIEEMIRQGADWMLWLDSDMRIPRDALIRLLKHREDVVGINYAKRTVPSDFVAIKRASLPPEKCVTLEDSTGLEEVEALGFGCVLIRTACLRGLPDPKEVPWFQNVHLGGGKWMGEDVWFCKLLRENGVKIHVDHDLSKECRHIGQFEYECSHAAAELEAVA